MKSDQQPTQQLSEQESRKVSILRCIQSLVHTGKCRTADCPLPACHKMKRVLAHLRVCQRRGAGCEICKHFIALCCYHAKDCRVTPCPVPFCANIKRRLQEHLQQRLQRQQILRQRRSG